MSYRFVLCYTWSTRKFCDGSPGRAERFVAAAVFGLALSRFVLASVFKRVARRMTQITIELPDSLAKLPPQERELLIRAGLQEAMRARRRELEREVERAQQQIAHFESQYGMSLAQFETELLPTLETPQIHEDYNDWFFWQNVLDDQPASFNSTKHQPSGSPGSPLG